MFSEDQLEQLRSFPEVSRDELIRYFTPTAGDVAAAFIRALFVAFAALLAAWAIEAALAE
jgi:hypothetical protein